MRQITRLVLRLYLSAVDATCLSCGFQARRSQARRQQEICRKAPTTSCCPALDPLFFFYRAASRASARRRTYQLLPANCQNMHRPLSPLATRSVKQVATGGWSGARSLAASELSLMCSRAWPPSDFTFALRATLYSRFLRDLFGAHTHTNNNQLALS